MGMFDDLIPQRQATPPAAAPRGMFDDLIPRKPSAAQSETLAAPANAVRALDATTFTQRAGELGNSLMGQAENVFRGAAQRTNPNPSQRTSLGQVTLQDDAGNYYFKGPDGTDQPVDLTKHNLLRDPSGNLTVYQRDPAYDESGFKSAGRIVSQGLVVSPLTGPASQAAINIPRAARAAERAQEAADDITAFDRQGVPLPPGAFNSAPSRGLAKSLAETPVIGAPVNNALENTYEGVSRVANQTAGRIGQATTPREAGLAVETGIERFKDARPQDVVDELIRLPENATPQQRALNQQTLTEIIAAPAAETSLKTKQAALYERAWQSIPFNMRAGRSVEDTARVMQGPANTRAVLDGIVARNGRMVLQSGNNAVPANQLSPVTGGLLGRMIEAVRNPRWTANLQTLRDMRSDFRRLASGMADTEKNVLKLSDVQRIQSAIGRDMIALLQRNAQRYRDAGDVQTAQGFEDSIRQFRVADRFTSMSAQRLETIEKLFKAETPEAVARNITNAAMAGGKGNFNLLYTLSRTLRPDELNDVRAVIFRELGRPVNSAKGIVQETDFSAESFLSRWRGMSDESKRLLFSGEHRQAIDDVYRIANRLANVEGFANRSRSGTNAVNVTGTLAAIGSVATGDLATPIALLGGGTAFSLLLSRQASARWAAHFLRLKAGAAATPGRFNAAVALHINRLAEIAKREPDLTPAFNSIAGENGVGKRDGKDNDADQPGGPDQTKGGQRSDLRGSGGANVGELRGVGGADRLQDSKAGIQFGSSGANDLRGGDEGDSLSPMIGVPFGSNRVATTADIPNNPQRPSLFDSALSGLNAFGEASLALGPMGEAVYVPARGISNAMEAFRSNPRAVAATFAGERALPPQNPEMALKYLGDEVNALIEQGRAYGINPGPMPDAPLSTEEQINMLSSVRDSMKARLEAKMGRLDKVNANAPVTSVPSVDGVTPMYERTDTLNALERNPYTQAIPGRQGFPTKREQMDLARNYFERGGRLPPEGPWGRPKGPTPDDLREVLRGSVQREGRTVGAQNRPSVGEIVEQLNKANDRIKELEKLVAKGSGDKNAQLDTITHLRKAMEDLRRKLPKENDPKP